MICRCNYEQHTHSEQYSFVEKPDTKQEVVKLNQSLNRCVNRDLRLRSVSVCVVMQRAVRRRRRWRWRHQPWASSLASVAAELALIAGCLLLCLLSDDNHGVNALSSSCRCVTFEDTYGKEYGVFTSPNWPVPYEESIECVLYTFRGTSDQLVEITFDEFDVQKTSLE